MAEKGESDSKRNNTTFYNYPLANHPLARIASYCMGFGFLIIILSIILGIIINELYHYFLPIIGAVLLLIAFVLFIITGSMFPLKRDILFVGFVLFIGGLSIILVPLIEGKPILSIAEDIFGLIFILLLTLIMGSAILIAFSLKFLGYVPKEYSQKGNLIDYDPYVCSNCGGGPLKSLNRNNAFECKKCHHKYYRGEHFQ